MSTAFDYTLVEKKNHITWITINRPDARNALNSRCHTELRAAFEKFRDDEDAWVAVLTGAGDKAFCAGADLKEAARNFASGNKPDRGGPPFGGITANWECWKPIIAAVNGFALGGGTELALACDLVVAADSARFGLPEPRRGIVAGAGGLIRMPRQLPLKLAMELILTGSDISAAEAYRLGLVNLIVPLAGLREAAEEVAEKITECSPASLRRSKRIALSYLHLPVDEALARQADVLSELTGSPDALEGTRAFAEKRPPRWTGQ